MARSPRAELLAIQKRLWRWNRELIDHSILVKEPGFASYERAYKRAVARHLKPVDHEEMIEAVLRSEVIYVGDYHTCNQSQRSFLRILKAVVRRDKRFALGMELLHKRHQEVLDRYLDGRISEATFLKRIKLKEHWVFDLWENFKPLFDFCRYHGVRMYAIDAAPSGSDVRARDAASARLLARIVKSNPGKRLFVLIGDLHIAPLHLPADLSRELAKAGLRRRSLSLYENSEAIYWRLAERGLDDRVEVVLLPDGNYCRMHTPPVVCQRSYLNWLEHEEGEIDYADAKSSFLEIVDRICEFLKVRLGKERDEVEVFTCGDLSFLKKLSESGKFAKREIETIKRQILASESYYIARTRFVYLANLSLNHAAEEASHFIKSVCSGEEKPREVVDAFYANILHEGLGFFGSKIINHKRKCYHERDFENLLAYFQSVRVPRERMLEHETAALVTEYKRMERKGRALAYTDIFRSRMDLFLAVTHALGYMLGDRLYYGLVGGRVKKADIRELFCDPWEDEGAPVEAYMRIFRKVRGVRIPKRM
ncbi:MAG: ChaN family lipoprotein [Proteobacteria bacterium]|nr:ChaN family lipoprotein [Pseudomonadota bacterium]